MTTEMCLGKTPTGRACRRRLVPGEERCAAHHAKWQAEQARQAHLERCCAAYTASGAACPAPHLPDGVRCGVHERQRRARLEAAAAAEAERRREAERVAAEERAYEEFQRTNHAWWPAFVRDMEARMQARCDAVDVDCGCGGHYGGWDSDYS